MKAITHRRYGPPEVLTISDVPKPVPGANEILVRVCATEATKGDCEQRSFRFPVQWYWVPLRLALGVLRPRKAIPGSYFSGVIEAVGAQAAGHAVGDAVFGCAGLRRGTYCEYTVLPAHCPVLTKPANLGFEAAAAVPLGGLNALHFLHRADVRPGERMLVNGAGGSIGAHVVQMAKAMGAEVTAVDAAHKEAFVRRMGADDFIDYRNERFYARAEQWDVIFSTVPSTPYGASVRALKPNGRYLIANPRLIDMLRAPLTTRRTDKTVIFAFARESKEGLTALREMIEAGTLRSIVDRAFPLAEAAEAHRMVESEARCGAIVLSIGADVR